MPTGLAFVVAIPPFRLSTPDVYKAWDKLGGPRSERAVLDHIDGERTVREIIAACHMSSFDTCKILYQLIEARLVRKRAA